MPRETASKARRRVIKFPKTSKVGQSVPFLNVFYRLAKRHDKDQLKKLLANASKSQLQAISECALNILQNSSSYDSSRFLKRLQPHKIILRTLSNKSVPLEDKRKKLLAKVKRTGGVFPLALLAPFLSSVLGAAVSKVIGSSGG